MSWLHAAVLMPFLFAVFVPLLHKKIRHIHTGWFVLAVPLLLFIYFAGFIPLDFTAAPIIQSIPWIPSLDIHFTVYLDGLSLLFALIITGIGFLVVFYSIYYMSMDREALHNFYVYLLLFMGAMIGIVLSDNLLVMYVFWEMTSISSFLLIAYWYQRSRSRYGARKAMMITMSGGFAMLLGFIMLYSATGTFSIRELIGMADQLADHSFFIPAMILILLGAFTKSAQFPFHIWLPDAMEAPTPISAYLHSATMVKTGVYLVARLTPIFGGHMEWFWIITITGAVTLFWGSFMAIRQADLKALLAYSTISQLGLIMSLLGIGSVALNGDYSAEAVVFSGAILAAIFHLVNHSIFKGCLFMVIGILDHETGTRDIRKLGGLMSLMPVSFTLTVIGGLSMAGLPPFSGFLSKEMFFTGLLTAYHNIDDWVVLLPVFAWIASILTFVYCLILVFKTFTGPYRPDRLEKKPHEASPGMLIAPSLLAVLVVLFFFFPNLLSIPVLEPAVHSVLPTMHFADKDIFHIAAWHGWTTEIFMTIGIIAFGSLMYVYLQRWAGVYDILPRKYTLNYAYDQGFAGMERLASRMTGSYLTGSVRQYLSYLFVFMIFLLGGSLFLQNNFTIDLSSNSSISFYEYVLGISLVASAVFVVFSRSRLISIIAVGAVGYIVSLFFVIFRAPDLALTQLVVETITTALFMLCFYYLPKRKKENSPLPFRVTNVLISVGVGVTLTLIGLSAQGHQLFEPIAGFFENSYKLAGAFNMVNAILVDFRAFDTMLEIVVLFSAGLGVYTLIKLRQSGGNDR